MHEPFDSDLWPTTMENSPVMILDMAVCLVGFILARSGPTYCWGLIYTFLEITPELQFWARLCTSCLRDFDPQFTSPLKTNQMLATSMADIQKLWQGAFLVYT